MWELRVHEMSSHKLELEIGRSLRRQLYLPLSVVECDHWAPLGFEKHRDLIGMPGRFFVFLALLYSIGQFLQNKIRIPA